MMNLTIPDELEQQLKIVAEHNHVSPTDFILSLLRDVIKQSDNNQPIISCFDLMQDGLGCIEDAPSDLSTNKKYFEGYGK